MKHLSNNNYNQNRLTNVPTPVNGGDAVNKEYADTKQLKSMFNVQDYGAVGDGSDATTAFQSAYDAASAVTPKGTVFVPRGRYMISSPVNMKGASTTGESQEASVILANPATTPAQWKAAANDNSVAQFYAINQNNWTFENMTLNIQDCYTKGVAAWGGDNIHFRHIHAFDSANCTMQLMGSHYADHNPITNSSIRDCIAGRSRWNYILDGEAYSVTISNNVSYDAVNRHISMDPQESVKNREQRGIVVIGNTCEGRRDFPSAWLTDPSPAKLPDYAIGSKSKFYGIVSNNYIRNWTDVVTGSYNPANDTSPSYAQVTRKVAGLGIKGAGGSWTNNVIHLDGISTTPMDAGIEILDAASGLRVSGNALYNVKRGIVIDGSSHVEVSNNMIDASPSRYTDTLQIGTGRQIQFSGARGSNLSIVLNQDKGNARIVDDATGWLKLGATTLASSSKTITVNNLPPGFTKLLIRYNVRSTGGTTELRLRFNNDSGTNYEQLISNNGSPDAPGFNQTQISGPGNEASQAMGVLEVNNIANETKIVKGEHVRADASGPTSRREGVWTWNNTSSPVSRVDLVTTSTGSYAGGSEIEVFGRS